MHDFLREKGFEVMGIPDGDDEIDLDSVDQVALSRAKNQLEQLINGEKSNQTVDISLLERRVDELNFLTNKDGDDYVKDGKSNMFKLEKKPEVSLFIFTNGIVLDKVFYALSTNGYKSTIKDILDGYVPSVLKGKFPKGVLINLLNNLHTHFDHDDHQNGLNLPKLVKPLSSQEFLAKMPEKVVRGGKVYEIRKDMEQYVNVKSDNEAYYTDKEELNFEGSGQECKIKLNVRRLDKILQITVGKDSTVAYFFEQLKNHLVKIKLGFPAEPKIYTAFPRVEYQPTDTSTLDQAGFFPTIFLQFD